MQTIFEKSIKFKEKALASIPELKTLAKVPEEAFGILNVLDEKLEDLTRKISSLKPLCDVLSREIYYVETELDEFLLLYYEKFSEVVLNSNFTHKLKNIKTLDSELNEEDYKNEESLALFDNKNKARDEELKKTYRLLVKQLHPDVSDSPLSKFLFNHVNKLYEDGNIDELSYIKTRIESGKEPEENIVRRIEILEKELELLEIREKNLQRKS